MTDLTGRLLVAVPQEQSELGEGDVFTRSVVLVLHHDEEGAHGLILNRPLSAEVDAVLPGWQEHVSSPDCVFQGGPVSLDTALALASADGNEDESLGIRSLFGGICLVDLDAPPPIIAPVVDSLRIYAGYAGWGEGQLENEIDVGMWFVVDAQPGDAFSADPGGLWTRVLKRQHSPVSFAATFPSDPDLN
ncbi:MAG TPA: YqgE/AlgH family protein [Flexivirga sp.]|uniref:YqgE/AlgH family protein n=1 Tax=Flexivirga sp. TaxID=1962927 RepID=UPI002CACEC80|nr:YqgE/AlgH family protein [Flexivirga sp.]HWC23244.1 YqgE/AlgH family protein [Flexivirga sp.]